MTETALTVENPVDSPYDLLENWLQGDFKQAPWPKEKIAEFQKRLDSAFGAENAFLLVWSGDRTYGDKFFTDWDIHGNPKGELEAKPLLLFKEISVGPTSYIYVSAPRWMIVEVHHGSQLEAGWDESSWVTDPDMTTGRKRIRDFQPPEFFYAYFRTIAEHEEFTIQGVPFCCAHRWNKSKSVCYGKYREPNDTDIAAVRQIRINQDKSGVVQRNDEARCAKILKDGNAMTGHFVKAAQRQKMTSVKDMMLEFPQNFFGDILEKRGVTMTPRELESIVREGLESEEDEKFDQMEKMY